MKILHVEDFFHPDAGYQINILAKYLAKKGHEVIIVTSKLDNLPDYLTTFFGKENIVDRDEEYSKLYGVKILRIPAIKYINGRSIFGRELIEAIKTISPDMIYSHGNDAFSGMKLIYYCTRKGIPLISDSHMLEVASKNKFKHLFRFFYRATVSKRIVKYGINVIRTQDDDYVIKNYKLPLELCPFISFGSDLLLFHPDNKVKETMRLANNVPDDAFVIMYAGKLDKYKGGILLAEAIKEKLSTKKKVVFLIVGSVVGEYGNEVESILNKSENVIIRYPTQTYVNLPKFYQMADLALFPKQCSLSFYDVQACGLPVVLEFNDLNNLRLVHSNGKGFAPDNVEEFRKTIEYFVNMPNEEYEVYKKNAVDYVTKGYDYDAICDRYLDIIEKEYKRQMDSP